MSTAQGAGGARCASRIVEPPVEVSSIPAAVHDISETGACLVVRRKLAPVTRYSLILTDAMLHYTLDVTAEVVWTRAGRVGLRWIGMSPMERVRLKECLEKWSQDPATAYGSLKTEVLWMG